MNTKRNLKIIWGFILGLLLLLLVTENIFVMSDSSYVLSDTIIVLGYPANKDGSLSDVMISRVDKGIELMQQGFAPRIIFSGGGKTNEAVAMAKYAKSLGVSDEKIFIEPNSMNTIENAKFCVGILSTYQWDSAIVVTSPYHMRRTKIIFEKYSPTFYFVKSIPPDDLGLLTRVNDIFHEILSFLAGAY